MIKKSTAEDKPVRSKKDIGIYDLPERKRLSGSLFQAACMLPKRAAIIKACRHA